jgi:type IV pilus assembly protein PilN
VKPLHLNLAARPYRDYRPVYAAVVVMSLLAAFMMLNNIDTYYQYIYETRNTRAKIADIEHQTDAERQRADMVERRLRSLDLKLLEDQTRFVNTKLRERAFSWSVLLDQLETILPPDVRILTISPTVAPTGAVNLAIGFESKSPQGLIKILNNMQGDPRFWNPFPASETNNAGIFTFDVSAQYFPPGVQNPNVSPQPAKAVKR